MSVGQALHDHVRLTALDRPFTCSCDPDTSDASQSWTDHAIAVLARAAAQAQADAWDAGHELLCDCFRCGHVNPYRPSVPVESYPMQTNE